MILNFSLENWMSFRERATFSMVASRERQHGHRVARLGKYQARVLPVAAIYGGNASGKTNFFKALSFAKSLIVGGTRPDRRIDVKPFRLDAAGDERPSKFLFELLVDETIYELSFSVTRTKILEEKLVIVTSASERTLYERRGSKIEFDASLAEDQMLRFVFRGTRDNQLFLTNSVSQNVDNFRPVHDWFLNNLELVAPDTRFEPFEQFIDEEHPLYSAMNETLSRLDTGIVGIGSEDMPIENASLPDSVRSELEEIVREGAPVKLLSEPAGERFVIARRDGRLIARRLVASHSTADGSEVKFDVSDESDGSQRVIELMPAFLDLSVPGSKKVFVIDEIDRSLHTLMTRELLETYLDTCSTDSRTQLLFTTHDVFLMNQRFLRRDEMWVTERDADGASTLYSFSDFKEIRYDKDIRKSYLLGRLGGIPRIIPGEMPVPSKKEHGLGVNG